MNYVVIDLEATCWNKGTSPNRMEIIEIGAVYLDSSTLEVIKEFSRFVKPMAEPILSDFCKQLTNIKQFDVDSALGFPSVLYSFLKWVGTEPIILCSWGAYDLNQLKKDCQRHGIPLPEEFQRHINLKTSFSQLQSIKPCGMKRALNILGLQLDGTHHRGIDDARNIAKIARIILPCVLK